MLGMMFTFKAETDRIIIDRSCLFNSTLEDLLKKLQGVTMNIQYECDSNGICRIDVFFQENDRDNYKDGYEQKVLTILNEHTHRVKVPSGKLSIEAQFQPAL